MGHSEPKSGIAVERSRNTGEVRKRDGLTAWLKQDKNRDDLSESSHFTIPGL